MVLNVDRMWKELLQFVWRTGRQTSTFVSFRRTTYIYVLNVKSFRYPSRGGSPRQTSMGIAFLRPFAYQGRALCKILAFPYRVVNAC